MNINIKLVFVTFATLPAVRGHPGRVRGHPGRDLADSPAAASGCPFTFVKDGAASSYLAQNSGYSEVTCDENNKNCQVPTTQGLQTNTDMPCLQDIAPAGMTCKEVSESWTLACQDSATATANLADGFKCGCMSDKVQNEKFCERTCGLCSPVFVNSEVRICIAPTVCVYFYSIATQCMLISPSFAGVPFWIIYGPGGHNQPCSWNPRFHQSSHS